MLADKRSIGRGIKNLQAVKTWQLAVILVLLLVVAATLLRMNNTGMVAIRNAVLAADKSGDVNALATRMNELRDYSLSHMNATVKPLYLQEQYNRDAQKAINSTADLSGAAADAHAKAEAACHPLYSGWSTNYMNCFLRELAKYPTSDKLPEPNLPNPALYRYSFASPLWSPDFAGWSVLACIILALVIVVRLITLAILRVLLHRRYREA